MVWALIVLVVIVVMLFLWFVGMYNSLIRWRNRVKNGWAQIDVQLKRRYDLIPNLVNTVKGYAAHEKQTFESVTRARNMAISQSGGVAKQAEAENFLSQTLKSLFAVVENYPELKANENFKALQEELTSTENKIAFARQFYNDTVMKYNIKIQSVPTNIVAGMFNFKPEELFEIEMAEAREAPKVEF
jgi:LemA protein